MLAAAAALLAPCFARAETVAVHAHRATSKISIDGRLDEPAWAGAPAFDHFVETFPKDGAPAPPELATDVRVLYDDEYLYVGVRCHDPHPELVNKQLSRRDTIPTSDFVEIALDPTHRGNTGYTFIINAAGVQRDELLYGDVNSTDTWDAVWDGRARVDEQGWTAELAIPLRVLRFGQADEQVWGIDVRRVVPRTHETFDSAYIARGANPTSQGALVVSRFGTLVDLAGLKPKHDIELAPYLAARLTSRPQFSDPSRPHPTLLDPSLDVGLDAKSALTSSLNLSVAINPDFGQVEADQLIQNVSTVEQFFPEKRPFFTQGLDLFQPVGAEYGSPQQMFYSRRIGLDAPILGAAKLSGSVREGTDVGVLDAVVMGAGNPSMVPGAYEGVNPSIAQASPDRRWQFHPSEPFHLGPNDALPDVHPITRNYFAAVTQQQVAPGSTVGAVFTSAVPLANQCVRSEFPSDAAFASANCSASGGNAGALDFNLRSSGGVWGALGQLSGSEAVGGPPGGRMLQDGTVLKSGTLGYGGYFRAGRLGGEGFRFDVSGTYESPALDLNTSGFQQFNDYQWYDLSLHYVRTHDLGPFHSATVDYTADAFNWSADGRLRRGDNHFLTGTLQLPSFDTIFAEIGLEQPEFDTREIPGAHVGVERVRDVFLAAGINTDPNRPIFANLTLVGVRTFAQGPLEPHYAPQLSVNATWHPSPSLETYLEVDSASKMLGARFLQMFDEDQVLFGEQHAAFFSATLRQQVVLTPRLTLQLYAQLFADDVEYDRFFQASIAGRNSLRVADLTPTNVSQDYDGHDSALNVNVVLRWEYRLGSILYLVYTRSEQELPAANGIAARTVFPSGLNLGPVTQTVLVKWSYWWDV